MDLEHLPTWTEGGFHVVVESPRNATLKVKYEPDLRVFLGNRPLPLGFAYPYDWGFVPGTKAPDGDPVDALVYWDVASYPGVVLRCRALAVLDLEQDAKGGGRERNDRLVVVPLRHVRADPLRSAEDLAPRVRAELAHFFTSAVFFEPKHPRVLGWRGPDAAEAMLRAHPAPREG